MAFMRIHESTKRRDCLQARTFDESYVSATNTEKPEVSMWRSCEFMNQQKEETACRLVLLMKVM